jgi:hypothetical protein
MDGYNIFGLIAILGCTLIGLYWLIVPQKFVKNDDNDFNNKIAKVRIKGVLLTILGIIGIILIIAL